MEKGKLQRARLLLMAKAGTKATMATKMLVGAGTGTMEKERAAKAAGKVMVGQRVGAFGKMEKGKLQRARLLLMAKAGTKATTTTKMLASMRQAPNSTWPICQKTFRRVLWSMSSALTEQLKRST